MLLTKQDSNLKLKTHPQGNPTSRNSKLKTIFGKALARGWVAVLAFAGGMFLFEFITVVTYPSIGGTGTVRNIFETLGPDMQRLLKLVPNLQVGFGPRNYLAFGYFHPVFLGLGSAFAVSRASDAIAGDVERGTILFVLSRPVARSVLLLGKAAELALSLLVVVGGAVAGTAFGVAITDLGEPIALWPFVVIGFNAYCLFLALAGVALIISALNSSAARVAGWATAFALAAFVADFLSVLPLVSFLGFFSPFRYYDPQAIVGNGGMLPWLPLGWLLGVALVSFYLALLLFQRRDITA